jgi:hypothetical protein
MNQKLFFFFHLVVVLCMALSTNNLFAQRPPRVSSNPELNNQSSLVTQQPVKGRLDVDTRTLKEGKNVVCQNPNTGKLLVAVVKKGQIVSWEVETTAQTAKLLPALPPLVLLKPPPHNNTNLTPKRKHKLPATQQPTIYPKQTHVVLRLITAQLSPAKNVLNFLAIAKNVKIALRWG